MCETKTKNIFQEELEIHDDIMIERGHRTKGKTTTNNTAQKSEPRKIVIKLANYKDKSMILRNIHKLKGGNIFIMRTLVNYGVEERAVKRGKTTTFRR